MKRELGTIFSVALFIMSCGHSTMNSTLSVNPRDTVNVPDYLAYSSFCRVFLRGR